MNKTIPPGPNTAAGFPTEALARAARELGTPLYVYDPSAAAARVARLGRFDTVRFAVKANPNLAMLSALRQAGAACDTVSAGEIERALAAGFRPEQMVYTSDVLDAASARAVAQHRVHVNAGSPSMIDDVAALGVHDSITLRVNPGFGDGHDDKVTTGGPLSKHGIWHEQLGDACARAASLGLRVSGLHVHIGSGASTDRLQDTIAAMERAIQSCRATLERVSCGGGMAVPYRDDDRAFDLEAFQGAWCDARDRWSRELGRPIALEVEPGRYLVAHAGVLLTEVRGTKTTGSPEEGGHDFVLVDAGFHTLVRPMLYGAFHRITVLGREHEPTRPRLVAGPLCESADVLTQGKGGKPAPQPLPEVAAGDLLVFHDVGAYGASMSSCYNSRPLPAEAIVLEDGTVHLARAPLDLQRLIREELELLPPALRRATNS